MGSVSAMREKVGMEAQREKDEEGEKGAESVVRIEYVRVTRARAARSGL